MSAGATLLKGATALGGHRRRHRAALAGFPAVIAAEPVTLRYLGTAVNQSKEIAQKVKADLGITIEYVPVTTDDVSQAHHHPARLVRHRRRRVLLAPQADPLRQPDRHGRQADQVRRQDHPGVHQGRGRRQEDRRPGHRAEEGVLPRGPDLDQVLADADPVDHPHPDRLQRRHARHPARPDQAPDRHLGGAAQPRVQGQGLDPQHPVDRHHGRGDGRGVDWARTSTRTRAT